jgi:hypothetical protein
VLAGGRVRRADKAERHAQLGHRVLDAAERCGVDRVPGVADDEEFAQSAAEQEFGRNARVGTGHQHGKRRLSPGDLQPAIMVEPGVPILG